MKEKKNKGFFARCPLAVLIILSALMLTVIAVFGMVTGYYKSEWGLEHPALEAVLLNDRNETEAESSANVIKPSESSKPVENPGTEAASSAVQTTEPSTTASDNSDMETSTEAVVTETAIITEAETLQPSQSAASGRIPRPMNYYATAPVEVKSWYYDDPGQAATYKTYDYIYGDDAYFEDALFIGDSRTQGLYYYGDLKTATFAYLEGVSLFSVMSSEFELSTGGTSSIEALLKERDFKKIYIQFGLNELGDHTAPEYGQYFAQVIQTLIALEPDAVVTLMGSMPISTAKSQASEWRNNDNIKSRNYWSAFYSCDNTDVFYLDNNLPEILDEYGGLKAECSGDGLHLMAQYYSLWCQNIRNHCLHEDMWS